MLTGFQLNDTFNFLSKLSVGKLVNAAAVTGSYFTARYTGLPVQWGLPFNISVEPTTQCNLACPECVSGLKSFTRPTGYMQQDFFERIVDELGDKLMYLYFYFQGEPYLHPAFLDMVKYASQKKIYTVTSTNAHFLSERKALETVQSGLDRILISIDGATQESYEQYRVGGKLDKVIEGAKNIVEAKRRLRSKTPHIVLQFLILSTNEGEMEAAEKLALETGVDEIKFKTAQLNNFENGNDLMPAASQYSRYERMSDGRYQIKNELLNHCWKLWHSCVITWDGRITPCCFDKDASHQLGDLRSSTFRQIWNSPEYLAFRSRVLSSRASVDICTNCSEGTKVWA